MGLYERWTTSDIDATNKISVHVFGSALSELARGAVTRSQLISAFAMDATDVAELDLIIATYNGIPAANQPAFVSKLEDVMILSEAGFYTKAKAKTELGF